MVGTLTLDRWGVRPGGIAGRLCGPVAWGEISSAATPWFMPVQSLRFGLGLVLLKPGMLLPGPRYAADRGAVREAVERLLNHPDAALPPKAREILSRYVA
jgi:hypothetical protein